MKPTEEQMAAITAPIDEHALVQAGPGTGKSTVIAERVAWLLGKAVLPRDILVLTFTRSGASSVRFKVLKATGQEVRCETFDGYAHSVLKRAGVLDGLQVATEMELETAIRGLYDGGARLPRTEACNISSLRKALRDWQSGKHEVHGLEAKTLATLDQRLHEVGRVPLANMVPEALLLLCDLDDNEDCFRHVLVDEQQDLTDNEEQLVGASLDIVGHVFAVGDKAQGIMQFRGAIDNAFEPLAPETYKLTQSFRFGSEIAEAVNVVGRRLGVPDVVGCDAPGTVRIEDGEGLMSIMLGEPDTFLLAPTNIECETLLKNWGPAMTLVRRSPFEDPFGENPDGFQVARDLGVPAISTIHGARGREAETVYVTGLGSPKASLRPYGDKMTNKLAYVALSRAKSRLVVVEG